MYPYRMITLHYKQVKSNPICENQDSNCGQTNRSVQVKRYTWQVSLFLKIAINSQIGICHLSGNYVIFVILQGTRKLYIHQENHFQW